MRTNKEKMLGGELYFSNDPELIKDRNYAHDLLFEYNRLLPSDIDSRRKMLRKLFAATGENFWIESAFFCDYGYNIYLGENFYANANCVILDTAPVKFGDNVMLAPNVNIYTAGHPVDVVQRNAGIEYAYPVTIGNNVWIGGNTTVLPGVTIGDNVVIGGGSVVTKDIPPNVIAVGNPCKVLKRIEENDK